ncbi:MAG: pseudaminic acid cytidylyltransferase [Gemmatimonadota bacterium]
MNVAVIPARGGSRRIPRKNIREFCGRPMIGYAVETALTSGLFEHVIVSTDDDEIEEVALAWGAEVPFRRPAALADDHTGTTDVVAHAAEWLRDRGWAVDAICCIYPTAPFLTAADLSAGLELLSRGDRAFVFSACAYRSPIFRAFRENENGGIEMFFPEAFETRSQDLPRALHDAGQFYWGQPKAWLERRRIFDSHSSVVLIPALRVQDVDTEEDWARAERMYRALSEPGGPSFDPSGK